MLIAEQPPSFTRCPHAHERCIGRTIACLVRHRLTIMPTHHDCEADQRHAHTRTGRLDGAAASHAGGNAHDPTEALFTSLYRDLRRLARREVRRNGAHDLLGTGTLVHETWLNISKRPALDFDEPGRFLAYAARTMRGLVIDRVRSRCAQKRGGHMVITSLDTLNAEQLMQPETLDGIAEALEELEAIDPALAHVVDLKFFCGFTLAEVATMKGVSERTVQRQWEKARLLLHSALS
jgi:RNA polymerase sigma factor (TIGR02999 family)